MAQRTIAASLEQAAEKVVSVEVTWKKVAVEESRCGREVVVEERPFTAA